jgi:cysteine-rich repeat protein
MQRFSGYAFSGLLLAGAAFAVVQCSGDKCGDGTVQSGEQCDNGALNGTPGNGCSSSCQLVSIPRAQLQVSFERLSVNVDPSILDGSSYPIPTCSDLGIAQAHLTLSGPTSKDDMVDCDSGQFPTYDKLDPGSYQATVTFLDAQGTPVTKPVVSAPVDVEVGSTPAQVDLVFQTSDYMKSYTGNFDFVPGWGHKTTACNAASITQETLTLTPMGSTAPLAKTTCAGVSLSGNAGPCHTACSPKNYDEAASIPWGYYDLTVTGLTSGIMTFCQKFTVFVGVGAGTPTYDLVVDPVGAADAGTACP